MDELIYYVNGDYVPASQAALPLNDLSIVRGYGIFDLLRTYGDTPFRLREHLQRLQSSAEQIGLACPWSLDELDAIVMATYAENEYLPDASIRIIVTGGASANFMTPPAKPTLVVMVAPVSPYPAELFERGCKVVTTRIERIMPTVKSLNYIGAIMAMQAAEKVDAVEALYVEPSGNVTEGTRSNLFLIKDGALLTPNVGVLPGITRQVVLEIAAAADYPIIESTLSADKLDECDEMFLTSTTKEVLPVVQVDGKNVGDGKVGQHTRNIAELFTTQVQSLTNPVSA